MRLQSEGAPYPADRGVRQPRRGRHGAYRPMGGVLGRRVQRAFDHLGHLGVGYRSWPTRAIFIGQPFYAILHEPAAPFADRMFMDTRSEEHTSELQSLMRTSYSVLCLK